MSDNGCTQVVTQHIDIIMQIGNHHVCSAIVLVCAEQVLKGRPDQPVPSQCLTN